MVAGQLHTPAVQGTLSYQPTDTSSCIHLMLLISYLTMLSTLLYMYAYNTGVYVHMYMYIHDIVYTCMYIVAIHVHVHVH